MVTSPAPHVQQVDADASAERFGSRIRARPVPADTLQTQPEFDASEIADERQACGIFAATMRASGGWLQRKCSCSASASPPSTGACEECTKNRFQAQLRIGPSNDPLEQEADRIAEDVMSTPKERDVTSTPPRVQRLAGLSTKWSEATPVSVDDTLVRAGRPLEPTLRDTMERRFGYDFSRVRVHTDADAAQSAHDVHAHAYTVGQNIVFGMGKYAPYTHTGQRLLAHELVHTLQQSVAPPSVAVLQRDSLDIALRSPTVQAFLRGSAILEGFALNRHTLTAAHKRQLNALAHRLKQLLRDQPLGTVEITGHTDATGDEVYNETLGQERADGVAAFLRDAGVPAVALHTQSAGESTLRVPTEKAEPRNRYVDVRFISDVPTPPAVAPEKPAPIPRPEQLCNEHPEICAPIANKPEAMPSCDTTNCSAVSRRGWFDKQPPDFQLVLTKSFGADAATWFDQLDPDNRMALTQIFNRMCRYGLWCHVRWVLKIAPGEAPVLLADRIFNVPGRTPSVYFTSPSGDVHYHALMATGRFCTAYGAGASQHPGQTTLREISGSDSLHISIGPGDHFDAHVDKYSPVPEHPGSSFCSNGPTPAAVGHIGREVVPEKVREITGIPGVQVFPEPPRPAPVPPGAIAPEPYRSGATLPPFFRDLLPESPLAGIASLLIGAALENIRITWRGPRKKAAPPLVPFAAKRSPAEAGVLPKDVIDGIRRALDEQVSPQALLPSPVRVRVTEARKAAEMAGPDEEDALRVARVLAENEAANYTDAHDVAFDLAAQMEHARQKGRAWVKLDMNRYGRYGGLEGSHRKALVGELRRIALILRNYLPERAAGVNTVVLVFGTDNLAVREEIRLPGWVAPPQGIFD